MTERELIFEAARRAGAADLGMFGSEELRKAAEVGRAVAVNAIFDLLREQPADAR